MPPAAPSARNGRRRETDRTVAKRMVSYRRRRQWAAWLPFGIGPCRLLAGEPCPYFRGGKGCPDYRLWSKVKTDAVAVCTAEKRAMLNLADSLAAAGWPSALATLVAAALLKGNRDGDGRLLGDALRTANGIGIEIVRAAARAASGPRGPGELTGYVAGLLGGACAPGGAA